MKFSSLHFNKLMKSLRKKKYNIFSKLKELTFVFQEMVERQLEYERVRLEAESRKATLELQEKVITKLYIK